MKPKLSLLLLVLATFAIGGCASHTSSLVTGTQRAPIDAQTVRIYTRAPEHFEEIAIIESTAKGGWSAQGKMDNALEGLKVKAASLGANGVLLTDVDDKTAGYYQGAVIYTKQIKAIAIHVP